MNNSKDRHKLIRITTIPLSLEKLLEGQLSFMQTHYDVTAISSDHKRLQRYGEHNGVSTYTLALTRKITPYYDLKAVYSLYRFLSKQKPLIVHTHTPKAGIIGMIAAYFAKVPLRLHTVAGLPLMEAKGIKRKILNTVEVLTYKCASNVYPNSKGLYDFIISEKFAKPKKLKILGKGSSNGIDTTYFDPALFTKDILDAKKAFFSIAQNNFVFVFVGRLVKDKGINEMVAAFQAIQKKHPKTTLLLVGPFENDLDPLQDKTTKAIESNSNIIHTGYQEDVRPFLALSNVLVFPSYREGFPNVVLQGGAMGLPSIVSNINGCNEIIKDHHNGILIPVKDQQATYNAMLELVENKTLYKSLATNARIAITENYSRDEMWQFLLKEYRNLEANL